MTTQLRFPVLGGREAGVGLEEFVEDRLVGEVEFVDDLLDGDVGVFQHVLGLEDDEGVDPVRGAAAAGLLYQFGQIFRRQAELVGVERHAALAVVVLGDELDEAVEKLLEAEGRGGCAGFLGREDVLGPDRTEDIHQGGEQRAHGLAAVRQGRIEQVVGQEEVLLGQGDLFVCQVDDGIVEQGQGIREHLVEVEVDAAHELARQDDEDEPGLAEERVGHLGHGDAEDVAGHVDQERVGRHVETVEVDVDGDMAGHAEDDGVAVDADRVLQQVQHGLLLLGIDGGGGEVADENIVSESRIRAAGQDGPDLPDAYGFE